MKNLSELTLEEKKNLPRSKLHEWWSKWHKRNCLPTAYMTDIDSIWIEIRNNKPVVVWDIKRPEEKEKLAYGMEVLAQWFEDKGIPVYILTIWTYPDIKFKITHWKNKKTKEFTEKGFEVWINKWLENYR